VHDVLEEAPAGDGLSRFFDWFIIGLIFANVAIFIMESVPAIAAEWGSLFSGIFLFSLLVFTFEYGLRLWACVDERPLKHMNATKARWKYAKQPLLIVDFLVVVSFWLALFVPATLGFLPLLRLLSYLKLARYSPALHSLGRVIASEKRALTGALIIMMALVLISATLMHHLEKAAQPEDFGTIPAAIWWALSTLTTVGYGDVTPVTTYGKLFGSLVMIFGLGMYALPIGIIATGFASQAHRREFVVTWAMVARVPIFSHLDGDVLSEIHGLVRSEKLPEGAIIMERGSPVDALYMIADGKVVAQTSEGDEILSEGQFFGELALLEDSVARVTVKAKTNCRLMALDKDDFARLLRHRPEVRDSIKAVARHRRKHGWTQAVEADRDHAHDHL
jgi:voltage-gated potassium channel